MPLEIRELIIRTTVDNNGGRNNNPASSSQTNSQRDDLENLVNVCIEKVMEALKEKNER